MEYQFVDPQEEGFHNEYFEIRLSEKGTELRSIYFTSNEDNLEEMAEEIVNKYENTAEG
ncbi:MAG: hypothetical protein QM669_00965 [Siphonobacter sp.]